MVLNAWARPCQRIEHSDSTRTRHECLQDLETRARERGLRSEFCCVRGEQTPGRRGEPACGACAGVYVCHGKCGARGRGIPTPLSLYREFHSDLTSAKGKWSRIVWIREDEEFEKIWSTQMIRDEEFEARLTCDILKRCHGFMSWMEII